MNKSTIIIDNDSLVNLTKLSKLNVFGLLRNVYRQILIPQEVRNEYEKQLIREPQRNFVLNSLRPNEGFWALCTRLDSYNNAMLFTHKGIDKGEAEIISQSEKTGVNLVISDDMLFTNACNKLNKNIKIYNSLFLLANLDLHGFVSDNILFFSELYKTRPFKHGDLINAYKQAAKHLQISILPKKISRNTFKQIVGKI